MRRRYKVVKFVNIPTAQNRPKYVRLQKNDLQADSNQILSVACLWCGTDDTYISDKSLQNLTSQNEPFATMTYFSHFREHLACTFGCVSSALPRVSRLPKLLQYFSYTSCNSFEPGHNKTYTMTCKQQRLRSACTSAQCDQSICWAHCGKPMIPNCFRQTVKALIRQQCAG